MDQNEYLSAFLEYKGTLSAFKRGEQDKNIPVIGDNILRLIEVFISAAQIKSVLEVGTATGASAMFFVSFIGKDARVVTVEKDEMKFNEAERNILRFGFERRITQILGDADEVLRSINGPFDMIFLDGAKGRYIYMLENFVRLLKPSGILIADNVLFRGMLSGEADLTTSVLKIGDGVSVSVKK